MPIINYSEEQKAKFLDPFYSFVKIPLASIEPGTPGDQFSQRWIGENPDIYGKRLLFSLLPTYMTFNFATVWDTCKYLFWSK